MRRKNGESKKSTDVLRERLMLARPRAALPRHWARMKRQKPQPTTGTKEPPRVPG